MSKIKDSGQRQLFSTGAQRDIQEGKGRFDLLAPFAEEELAKHFEAGSLKYDAWNFLKGIPLSRYLDSCKRHLNKYARGSRDEPHDVAALWNIYCFVETRKRIELGLLPKELDDLLPVLSQEVQEKL